MDNTFDLSDKFIPVVRNTVTSATAIGHAGLFGAIDTIAVGVVWITFFVAIKLHLRR